MSDGNAKGDNSRVLMVCFPLKLYFAIHRPANIPKPVEKMAVNTASFKLNTTAFISPGISIMPVYHFRENPSGGNDTKFSEVKELGIITRRGAIVKIKIKNVITPSPEN